MNSDNKNRLLKGSDRLIIALDGPSASGKGHIGRLIATQFNLEYFESSRVYRGLAYLCLQHQLNEEYINEIIALSKKNILDLCKGIDLFQEDIAQMASKISVIPEVRENLTKGLRKLIADNNRIIMEGRDISSVVAPDAHIKIFITADAKIRAERRYKQLMQEGKKADRDEILAALLERDKRDTERDIAPLVAQEGSIVIDTTKLPPDQVIEEIIKLI